MWLNIKWYADAAGTDLIREDGAYGNLSVTHRGQPLTVRTLLDLHDPNTKIYEAHMGMTREWADQLLALNYDPGLPLMYDRETGEPAYTLGLLAAQAEGTDHESFHFALNNTVVSDNRIPPFGMDYLEARKRNALPVPATQYGCDPSCTEYDHYDEFDLSPPTDRTPVYATVDLMYQPTSWEYIQFLDLANDRGSAFLGNEGQIMLDAWLATGMAEPVVMASAAWGSAPEPCATPDPAIGSATAGDKHVQLDWTRSPDTDDFSVYHDQSGKAQWIADVTCTGANCSYTHANLTNGQEYCYMLTATASCESGFSDVVCATPQPPGQQQLAAVDNLETGTSVKVGKGKNAYYEFQAQFVFTQGDRIGIRGRVTDESGAPVSGATFSVHINGPEIQDLTSASSDADGVAVAEWSTEAPNKKGNGGTIPGDYTATVSGLSAGSLTWDGNPVQASFSIGQ